MEKQREREWAEAQKIIFSVDLIAAAKNQIKFLAAVDRNRYLYEGPAMEWAIYRYNAYWLPLIAKHLENPISDDSLVVPLDCEWVWHCHRLNPVRYKSDCEKIFGRILGNHNIVSSIQGTSKSSTEEIWNTMYPEEPFELDHNRDFLDMLQKTAQSENFTSYDLASAIRRQVSFYYQVSRPHVCDNLFLQEALARYKGFLYLINTNRKNNIKRFCVPTYDVDLMWHSHQLHPISYCDDLINLLGKVLEHDDTDSDRTKGKKLDTGFSGTTKQWEETFGLSYWKAGAMYRGTTPTPVTQIPFPYIYEGKKFNAPDDADNLILLPEVKAVEVFLEFVEIKNLPDTHKGNLHVSFTKKQPDMFFAAKRTLTILSEAGEKQVAFFNCEPIGELIFELMCYYPSSIPLPKSLKPFGSCSLSFEECLASGSQLCVNKWLSVVPIHGIIASEPVLLHVSLSFTPPTPALQVFHLLQSQNFFERTCFFPVPKIRKVKHGKGHTCVIDDDGNDVLNLQMRDYSKDKTASTHGLLKEVLHITDSGETHSLAVFQESEWVVNGSHGSLMLRRTSGIDGYFFILLGHKMVKLFSGRKLDYEPNHYDKKKSEQDFMTAIEFSAEHPYGKAVALFDFKHGILKVMDEWMIVTGITLAFILSDILRKEGHFIVKVGCEDNMASQAINSPCPIVNLTRSRVVVATVTTDARQGVSQSGVCESGCDSVCGNAIDDVGCDGDGNIINSVHSGECGAPCHGRCGGAPCMNMKNCGDGAKIRGAECGAPCHGRCGSAPCMNKADYGGDIINGGKCSPSKNMANCGGCGGGGKCGGGKCGGK